jgi:hypothetical protein
MSFQAYLDNIEAKTGKSPADFRRLAKKKGFAQGSKLKAGVRRRVALLAWLKADYGLGHGHAMAIVALLKVGRAIGSLREPTRPDPSNSATCLCCLCKIMRRRRCKSRWASERALYVSVSSNATKLPVDSMRLPRLPQNIECTAEECLVV